MIKKIAPGLWQSALAHVLPNWNSISADCHTIALMATLAEPLPGNVPLIYFPIDDNASGTDRLDTIRELAKMLANVPVLTVCHIGENRSGLLSALILVERGYKPAEAVALVQREGPHNSPTQAHSFWNPGFVRQVLELS